MCVCVYLCIKHSLQQCMERLEKEVELEFSHTMNRMVFDKLVQASPEEFSYITLPEKEPERVLNKGLCMCVCVIIDTWTCLYRHCVFCGLLMIHSCTGCVSVPRYPFERSRARFTCISLLTKPEVISALSSIRAECNRVTAMSLFHVTFSKPLRLEEFELTQSQMHTQVTLRT